MKLYKSFPSAFLVMLIIVSSFHFEAKGQTTRIEGKWSGTVSMHERYDGITGWSEKWIDVSFSDNVGTGTIKYEAETIIEGKHLGRNACNGAGSVELWAVEIYRPDSTCTIETIGPVCSMGPDPWGVGHGNDIVILDKPWSGNPNLLSGNETVTARMPGDLGTVTTTYSWSLYRGPLDAQLIIIPNAYDIWMPKATKDELQKGSVMDIDLKVKSRNGGTSSFKAVRFELKLSNTSREPGTTLNMPLNPSSNQLPDIRFIPHTIGESIEEDQYLEIPSADGKTGKAIIASYDGGGWTTLTAVAVLEGGFRIEGTLLTPAGIKEIPIPKRNGTSKIATAWLTANGNPGEMDDKELLQTKPGDGLTAYEEYRGVISEGEFHRLKATEKEVGVMATRANHTLFAEGIRWFESASGIKVVRFDETEIAADRRLNRNISNAHDYDQYVLKLENGPTTKSAAGENRPISLNYMIPKQSELVVINVGYINTFYPLQEAAAQSAGVAMPYTKAELLASTVAHELGHGVNINHHGDPSILPQHRTAYEDSHPPYHIFGTNGIEIPVQNWKYDAALGKQYFEIYGYVGKQENEESGDLSCFMAYTSLYNWSYRAGADGSLNYYEVPLLPIGKKLCTSKIKTTPPPDINSRPNSKYFGAAAVGNCLSQIKLRD